MKKRDVADQTLARLFDLDAWFKNLDASGRKAAGAVLTTIWATQMKGGAPEAVPPYDDTTLRMAGVAKAIAHEYDLPGDFS